MKPHNITLAQFTGTFVPFSLLLSAALVGAEGSLDLPQYRMIYSIWVSLVLTIPALCLYTLPSMSQARYNLWALFWTFAYCAYLVHFYYAAFVHYHGSFKEMIDHQGLKITGPNLLATGLWGLDVILTWSIGSSTRWVRVERALIHFIVCAIFFISSVIIFKGFVNVLGWVMVITIAVSLSIRIFGRQRASLATNESQAGAG